ncbi:DNA-nicking endonuclease, Smr domain [Novosphingobium sp. CF614]|uniref:Smr/MutS family protein n=1 Tax=Novosphingobium sp. CF614 TaxID=1884364 RepID=UPI0008E04D0D|nr:Smr/MutS family protein [Novosphingobium sp. CF614]SFG11933.1 DNA-nicking endonuclease, Smr domain [Novosphingobium sp. CF614]
MRQRRLTAREAEAWAQVARTVKPLAPSPEPAEHRAEPPAGAAPAAEPAPPPARKPKGRVPPAPASPGRPLSRAVARALDCPPPPLDGTWERRIAKGALVPDFSLDLHGASLDQAHGRLMHGLTQARAMGARVVLVVTGKPRPVDAMDRAESRGAIRAKLADWLAASEHAGQIAAIRGAHRRHGGAGAVYLVLRRQR